MTAIYKKAYYRLRQGLMKAFLGKPQPKPMSFIGPGAAGQLAEAIGQFGANKILLVSDAPLMQLGLADSTIEALRAAGVVVVVSAGNNGPECETIRNPSTIFAGSFTVGAISDVDTIPDFKPGSGKCG